MEDGVFSGGMREAAMRARWRVEMRAARLPKSFSDGGVFYIGMVV